MSFASKLKSLREEKISGEFLKNIKILKNSYKKIEDISKINEEIFE